MQERASEGGGALVVKKADRRSEDVIGERVNPRGAAGGRNLWLQLLRKGLGERVWTPGEHDEEGHAPLVSVSERE